MKEQSHQQGLYQPLDGESKAEKLIGSGIGRPLKRSRVDHRNMKRSERRFFHVKVCPNCKWTWPRFK